MSFDDPRDTWNRRFARPGYLFGKAPNAWLSRHAGLLKPGGKALCVADGEGRNSVWLAQQGLQVQAFDIAELAVEKARELAREVGVAVDFQVAGWEQWPWCEAAFDVVVAIFIQFADPEERHRLFTRMISSLRPGGLLLVQGYGPRQIEYATGGPGRLAHLYTPALLRELCAGMTIVELETYEDVLDEGSQHVGRSDLIGLVAQRPA